MNNGVKNTALLYFEKTIEYIEIKKYIDIIQRIYKVQSDIYYRD